MINENNIFGIEEKWQDMPIETIEVFFKQAEQSLQNTVDISRLITVRAYTFISIILSFTLGGMAYSISLCNIGNRFGLPEKGSLIVLITTVILVIYLIVTLYKLIDIIFKRELKHIGTDPRQLIDVFWAEEGVNKDHKWILLHICNAYQVRIDKNDKQNKQRIEVVEKAIRSLAMLPFLIAFLMLLLSVCFGCFVV